MKGLTFIIFVSLLTGCSYSATSRNSVSGSVVGATGDIEYEHETLSSKKHFVTISAAPGMLETESSIAQRIHKFAYKFAAQTCSDEFRFIDDPNFKQDIAAGFMSRTKSYVFICE